VININAAPAATGDGKFVIMKAYKIPCMTKLMSMLIICGSAGFAYPWAKQMVLEKWASQVRIDGKRIVYSGSAMGLFGVWVKIFIYNMLTMGLYGCCCGGWEVETYVDKHLDWN